MSGAIYIVGVAREGVAEAFKKGDEKETKRDKEGSSAK